MIPYKKDNQVNKKDYKNYIYKDKINYNILEGFLGSRKLPSRHFINIMLAKKCLIKKDLNYLKLKNYIYLYKMISQQKCIRHKFNQLKNKVFLFLLKTYLINS
ncbi:hypothetical protein H311_00939 [Anncaliia algerae PRA109]|nr:hypothetical protein H311_00939 [Anncaliia algerae PRA109]